MDLRISTHIWNLLAVAVLGSITVAFLLIQRHEERFFSFSSSSGGSGTATQTIIYGTAWKEDKTADYVASAIQKGFRFIDTANQPKHYQEAGVGRGWTQAAEELGLTRGNLFLQTKFSPYQEIDPPYDVNAPVAEQVKSSVLTSLKNLQTDYIDSLILHSPMKTMEETFAVWKAMEEFVDQGVVKQIGLSNCYGLEKFKSVYQAAKHKPWALQNRFYSDSNFDTEMRRFCQDNGVWYQSFWTLTANRKALKQPAVTALAKEHNLTPQTLLFAFLMSLGYVAPLSGTTNEKHMEQDVQVMERINKGEEFFENEEELRKFAKLLGMPAL